MKAGLVALIGRSNVGKSTLLNTLVGTKIAATSFRAQMTRDIIHGVMNKPESPGVAGGQAVFIDTPGVFKDRKSLLSAKLTNKVKKITNNESVDMIVYVVDPTREIGDEELATYGMIRHLAVPKILVINKCDLPEKERRYQTSYERWSKDFNATFLLSAIKNRHVEPLRQKIMELLPEGEPMYPADQWTNIDSNFWIAEIIREKVFSVFEQEIPYTITVIVDEIEEKNSEHTLNKPAITIIKARVLTNNERYKKIIIGKGGHKIKEIGQMARRELETALNKKVYLELEVEIDKHWVERI